MSEIGTKNFFCVGYFQGIPVYQPLWTGEIGIGTHDERKENFAPGELIIGGGAGEHPAIIFHDLEAAVALLLCSNWSPLDGRPHEAVVSAARTLGFCVPCGAIEFCDWNIEYTIDFYERCKPNYEWVQFAEPFPAELEDRDDADCNAELPATPFELWLLFNIGEFVYAALPDISPRIADWRTRCGPVQRDWFRGIMIPPPGYPDSNYCPIDRQERDVEKARTIGGVSRFDVVDRFPGYHRNPEWGEPAS